MKRIKFLIVPIFILLFTSCSNDDDGFSKEDFLAGYLSETGFNEETVELTDQSNNEFGVEFSPMVNGNITELIVTLPVINNNLRVTLWNKSDMSILHTEMVDVSIAGETMIFNVDIELNQGQEYAITMNSDDWYDRYRTVYGDAIYPVTVGNIEILTYIYEQTAAQIYPTNEDSAYYSGDLSFNFQRTE